MSENQTLNFEVLLYYVSQFIYQKKSIAKYNAKYLKYQNFCYKGDKPTVNETERKHYFLQHKGKHCSSKESYMDRSKSTGRKVDYATVFTDITRRSLHSHS